MLSLCLSLELSLLLSLRRLLFLRLGILYLITSVLTVLIILILSITCLRLIRLRSRSRLSRLIASTLEFVVVFSSESPEIFIIAKLLHGSFSVSHTHWLKLLFCRFVIVCHSLENKVKIRFISFWGIQYNFHNPPYPLATLSLLDLLGDYLDRLDFLLFSPWYKFFLTLDFH